MNWEHILYFLIFTTSTFFVETWRERFACLMAAALFTFPPYIRMILGIDGQEFFLYYSFIEWLGVFLLGALCVARRKLLIVGLQLLSSLYFLYEYYNWNNYTWTYQYYETIQMVFLDLTLAILIINPSNKLSFIHFAIYTGMIFLL